jgi:hypothetical protein
MDTSAELMATVSQLLEYLTQLYLDDTAKIYNWWIIFYFPLYVLKWVFIFFPVFILVGGINGIRYRSRKNKTRQE